MANKETMAAAAEAIMATMATEPSPLQRYLTFVPRGLEQAASSTIEESLTSQCYRCEHLQVLRPIHETEEYLDDLSDKLRKQQEKKRLKEERRKQYTKSSISFSGSSDARIVAPSNETVCPVGTLQLPSSSHLSFGHYEGKRVFCRPGPVEGVLPMQFCTDAPPMVVAGIRGMGCGPLLALVASSHHNQNEKKSVFGYEQTVDEAKAAAEAFVGKDDPAIKSEYLSNFRKALLLWYDHAKNVWFANFGKFYGLNMNENDSKMRLESLKEKKDGTTSLSFRVSFLRTHSKQYKNWKREDIISELCKWVVPCDDLGVSWKVDLKHHDMEVMAIIHDTALTVAIPLRPYQHMGSKTYANGRLPPDLSPPYVSSLRSEECVRLRPSTAALLLHLARIEAGDIILDPCVGIGTIPIESTLLGKSCLGIGGDLALRSEDFARLANGYLNCADEFRRAKETSGAATLASWDALMLPVRDGSIDVCISDLPFGSKCMSAKKLHIFLPLLISDCARVLRPGAGRCVLLCGPGSFQSIISALDITGAFVLPCESVFPVNIGGLVAWIVMAVKKKEGEVDSTRNNDKHRSSVRKIASANKRKEQYEELGKTKETNQKKFRKLQS